MRISQLLAELQHAQEAHGDIEVVAGLDRSGYGEPVTGWDAVNIRLLNDTTGNFDGEKQLVVNLILDESTLGMARP